ncbi:MAG: hypothetical protein DCF23_08105 [Cyanobium sp.]|nr:MAG: hypothetical protein DCF23_08105 [Cyanobium sp.]
MLGDPPGDRAVVGDARDESFLAAQIEEHGRGSGEWDSPAASATVVLQPRAFRPEGPWGGLDPSPAAAPVLWLIDRRQEELALQRPALLSLLAPAERVRLERWRRADDRDRFLLGRAALRLLLGGLCGEDPAGLELEAGPNGKPRLAAATTARLASRPPEFNLAHSGDLVLLGFHPKRPVGVDVEWHRPGLRWEAIAGRCLTPALCQEIKALPAAARPPAFLRHWCRLEAELKARGTGFAVVPEPQPAPLPGVVLHDLALPQGYSGAAALCCDASPLSGAVLPGGGSVPGTLPADALPPDR